MSNPTVYLAGPINDAPDGGAAWRSQLIDEYGDDYEFHDPLAKYNVPADDLTVVRGVSDPDDETAVGTQEIVEHDKELVVESDGVLVGYSHVPSAGTPMEVHFAHECDIPVALWIRDDTDFDDLSPWYHYHTTAITTDPWLALRHLANNATEVMASE